MMGQTNTGQSTRRPLFVSHGVTTLNRTVIYVVFVVIGKQLILSLSCRYEDVLKKRQLHNKSVPLPTCASGEAVGCCVTKTEMCEKSSDY